MTASSLNVSSATRSFAFERDKEGGVRRKSQRAFKESSASRYEPMQYLDSRPPNPQILVLGGKGGDLG